MRLHGRAMFRARLIGVYFNGASDKGGEMWETQPLDLLGGMGLFREVSIISQNSGNMWLEMSTELPGRTMNKVATIPIPFTPGVHGRQPVTARLPGNTKGRLQQFRLVGPSISRLFSVKVLARRTQIADTGWNWINVPLEATADSFVSVDMPIHHTPEIFSWVDLPVDAIE